VRPLLGLEDLARDATGGAVDPSAGDLDAPLRGGRAEHREVVGKRLPREPPLTHVRHLVLDAGLVLRMADPRRVHEEATSLRVLGERWVDGRVLRVGAHDRRGHVVEHDALGDAAEEPPGCVQGLAERLDRLPETRPDELVAAHRERDDEHPELAPLALGGRDVADLTEVDLCLLARRRVVDEHGRTALVPPQILVRVPAQRRVRHPDAVSREKLLHSNQPQRWIVPEPLLDASSVLVEDASRLRRLRCGTILNPPGDVAHDLLGQLRVRRQPDLLGRLDVPRRRPAPDDALAGHLPCTLPCLPAAEHFLHVDHGQLPETHRNLPTASAPSPGGSVPSVSGRRPRSPCPGHALAP